MHDKDWGRPCFKSDDRLPSLFVPELTPVGLQGKDKSEARPRQVSRHA